MKRMLIRTDIYESLPRRPWRGLLQSAAEVFDNASRRHVRLSANRNSHSSSTVIISMIPDTSVSQGILSN